MYGFHVHIHARPEGTRPGHALWIGGQWFAGLDFPRETPGPSLPVTFEEAAASLARMERLFIEPDGSFVFSGEDTEPWQVDGMLFDRDGKLLYAELKGGCPQGQFDRLLATIGWPRTPLLFQLAREAVWLDEADFRRWALGRPAPEL